MIAKIYTWAEVPPTLAAELQDGTAKSGLLCPACAGGRTGELSLSARPRATGGVSLHCYRAGCGYQARIFAPGANVSSIKRAPLAPRPFTGPLELVTERQMEWLEEIYNLKRITLRHFGVQSLLQEKRPGRLELFIPVLGPDGAERGGIVRRFNTSGAKAISFMTSLQPWQSWYVRGRKDAPLVIVEDQLSAMRCWQAGFRAVALLGTYLGGAKLGEIANQAGGKAMLALDKDAFALSCQYARKYSDITKIRVVLLERDFKDEPTDEAIKERLSAAHS